MNNIIQVDDNYKKWINELSDRFRSSQIKAAARVNSEMLQLYWSIGRDISQMELNAKYGSGFYKRLSRDLKDLLPDVKSFSETNLRYMAWFYELYSINPQQAVVDLDADEKMLPSCNDYISNTIYDRQAAQFPKAGKGAAFLR